jgi:hypothetical protein
MEVEMFNSFGIKNGAAQLARRAAAVGTMAFVALTAAGGANLAGAQTGPSNTRTHTHTHTHTRRTEERTNAKVLYGVTKTKL